MPRNPPPGKTPTKWLRPQWNTARRASGRRTPPVGRYVYAWFKGDDALPFYVGRGVDFRAWARHNRSTNCDSGGKSEAAWCQTVRASAERFRVVIVRENLTEEGAILLESSLIAFVGICGGILTNQIEGTKRQEIPPLTLDGPQTLQDCASSLAAESSEKSTTETNARLIANAEAGEDGEDAGIEYEPDPVRDGWIGSDGRP
jgi:hypothetical protein